MIRPVSLDEKGQKQLVEADPSLSARELAEQLGSSHSTIHKHVLKMAKIVKVQSMDRTQCFGANCTK